MIQTHYRNVTYTYYGDATDERGIMYNYSKLLEPFPDCQAWSQRTDKLLSVSNITRSNINMINDIYINDFRTFGYEMI